MTGEGLTGEGLASGARLPPGWLPWVSVAVSLAGLGASTYLTLAHYTTASILACNSTGLVDCAAVTTSPQSMALGIPVAVLGVGWFVAMVGLSLPGAWRTTVRWVLPARMALAGVGMAFVLYLVYAELLVLHHICLWCTSVHVLTFVLFMLVALGTAQAGSRLEPAPAGNEAEAVRTTRRPARPFARLR